ncbi:MAG: fused MFS/spermidine synthase [Alphaproteobacteria bacterium]|nr:fused MFS/spermidine synthase [Alphaproteobacteria bacterium]
MDWHDRLQWLLLAFVPASLLLGVTQHITTDIASAPLLWVLPLILYLATFIVVFGRRPVIPHHVAVFLQVFVVVILAVFFYWRIRDVRLFVPLHLVAFFFLALVCHGELSRGRPAPSRLTEFYLWMSLGGVLGGAFTALLAPVLFDKVHEYPLALVAACLLRPRSDRAPMTWPKALPLAVILGLLVSTRLAGFKPEEFASYWLVPYLLALMVLVFACRKRPVLIGLAIAAILLAGSHDDEADEVAVARSFFGVNRIIAQGSGEDKVLVFKHGTTDHGAQYVSPDYRRIPLTYYHPKGPLGQVMRGMGFRLRHIGVVGLGVGSVACHQWGQKRTFYEIDPLVVALARDQRYFHYLSDCAPEARIVIGDGRLSLAREQGEDFDLLILDAFSSDAIPVHLLTREALAIYLGKLAPDGLLLFHVSNRHLDLRSVLANLAYDAGLDAYYQYQPRSKTERHHHSSRWVFLARPSTELSAILHPKTVSGRAKSAWQKLRPEPDARVWTDDYANVFGSMQWWRHLKKKLAVR